MAFRIRFAFNRLTSLGLRFIGLIIGKSGEKGVFPSRSGLLGFGLVSFPWTVKAVTWGKKEFPVQDPNSTEAKLVNKGDAELLADLKYADKIYSVESESDPQQGICHSDIYKTLQKHKDKNEPELFWRLARVIYELAKIAEKGDKVKLVSEAFEIVKRALELDEKNFAAHKWMAIILNEISSLRGTKEQITQSYNVKYHMERAAELNPKDATSIYLVGNWCFTVAEIPWYQKKIAETIFAKPPSCSYDEALTHFLKAENVQPLFYSMNLLMLAKSYMKVGNPDKAEEYLLLLKNLAMKSDEDFLARKEGSELLSKIQKSKKTGGKEGS